MGIDIKGRQDGAYVLAVISIIILIILIVFIWSSKTVTLIVDGEEKQVKTYALTVGQLLQMEEVFIEKGDKVEPGLNYFLKNGTTVKVQRPDAAVVEIDGREETIRYRKKMQMVATAYTYTGENTHVGVPPSRGTVAVDPDVIPLGTKLFIEDYGYCVALDTGGAIKGMRVDLFVQSRQKALRWGKKQVDVYILKEKSVQKLSKDGGE